MFSIQNYSSYLLLNIAERLIVAFVIIDSSGVDNIAWKLELPENVVADTVAGKVIINSDILGPMFQVNLI